MNAMMCGEGQQIRYMIRKDMPDVLAIEGDCDCPWTADNYVEFLRQSNAIGLVLEDRQHGVLGLVLYRLHPGRLELCRIAVKAESRRNGIGRMLIDRLRSKLSENRRSKLTAAVPDTRLDVHCLLRAAGFVAKVDGDDYAFTFCFDWNTEEFWSQYHG